MRVLLFDIDGTLLSTGGAGQMAMERALQSVFGVTRATHGIPVAGRTDRAITSELFAFHGISEASDAWRAFQESYFRLLEDVLPTLPGRTLPGIPELLIELSRQEEMLLGLLTGNFETGARLKLSHYGLDHHFQCGGFGDDHHDRDDVARAALESVQHCLQDPTVVEQLWVIGDTPADVRCGRAIGAQVVAVETGSFSREELQETEPDYLFADLSDPGTLLDLL